MPAEARPSLLINASVIEYSGYPAMWLAVAASSVAGGTLSIRIADRF